MRPREQLPIFGPVLEQHRVVAEPIQKNLVVLVEQVVQKAIERVLRLLDFRTRHAATRVESDAEAHGHMLGGEMGDTDRLVVFVHDEVVLPEA